MKRRALTFAALILASVTTYAETNALGIVSFNLYPSPINNQSAQPVLLYGCNTTVNSYIYWNSQHQVLTHLPYGHYTSKKGKPYYVAKYYLVSPPVPNKPKAQQATFLGAVTPHRFTLHGKKPGQIINLDYRAFHPVYFHPIPVQFDYKYNGNSCSSQKISTVPVSINCRDLPWANGALGASGIGPMTSAGLIFATLNKNKNPLHCTATILDDILLDFKVFFATKNGKSKTINLTKASEQSKPIKLICIPRAPTDIPSGCRTPTELTAK